TQVFERIGARTGRLAIIEHVLDKSLGLSARSPAPTALRRDDLLHSAGFVKLHGGRDIAQQCRGRADRQSPVDKVDLRHLVPTAVSCLPRFESGSEAAKIKNRDLSRGCAQARVLDRGTLAKEVSQQVNVVA